MITTLAGVLGLLTQMMLAVVVVVGLRRRSVAFALFAGALVAVYGYGLLISTFMMFAVPWQIANIIIAVGLAVYMSAGKRRTELWPGTRALAEGARTHWAAALVLIVVIAFQVLVNALKPELSIDGQLYHGPILASLVDTGTLWGWTPTNQYTYYTDLTMATSVNLATFTGATWFDDAAQVPQFVVLILAIVWALRARFRSALLRVALATLFVSAPVIWIQPRILYVDIAYGAAVFSLITIIVLTRKWDRSAVFLTGIAAAAVLATKPTGILTSAVLMLLAWCLIVRSSYRTRDALNTGWLRHALASIGLFILPFLGAVSFYVRNYIAFSNPVYPIATKVGPISFPGIVDLSVFTTGDRGSGLVDPGRIYVYLRSIWHGAISGVTKLDYDPRDGGYGYVPLALLLVVAAILILELAVRARTAPAERGRLLRFWPQQLGFAALAVTVLFIQPSTFDTRYVVGPTAALAVALALTTFGAALPLLMQTAVAIVALVLSVAQISWTEKKVYPGLAVILQLRTLPASQQPLTPGNPWGLSTLTSWLPVGECVNIAVQTSGGVTAAGMSERSYLATLSYGLYGDRLCNRVEPVVLSDYMNTPIGSPAATRNPLANANYAVLYTADLPNWSVALDDSPSCWQSVTSLTGVGDWPEKLTVLHNTCQ